MLDLAFRGRLTPLHAVGTVDDALASIAKCRGQLPGADSGRITYEGGLPFSVPEAWVWRPLRDVGAVVGGATPPTGVAGYFDEKPGHVWLTPADMRKHRRGKFIDRGDRYLTSQGAKACSAQRMPAGSVVFSSRAPIGHVAIAACELRTNQGFKSVVPYSMAMSDFVYWYLCHAAPRIDAMATGTTFKEVSGGFMSGYPIPVPPIETQAQIVQQIESLLKLCDQLDAALARRDNAQTRIAIALGRALSDV